jgi:hypothetical protein
VELTKVPKSGGRRRKIGRGREEKMGYLCRVGWRPLVAAWLGDQRTYGSRGWSLASRVA